MSSSTSQLSFKFRFVKQGKAQGLFSQKGMANEQEITFGKDLLVYEDIADTTTRDQRLVLALSKTACFSKKLSKHLVNSVLVLEIYGGKCRDLEKFIDKRASAKEIEKKKQRLAQTGQLHRFRSVKCPECEATIDLSDYKTSTYVYCRFCETIFQENLLSMTKGATYRLCDECGMFDRVRSYTEFYFYFLVILYGFFYQRRHVCDNCANGLFLKTLFLNLLFVIGVPASLWIKIKSLTGRDPYLKRLAKANALSKKGNYQTADTIYNSLYEKYPEHPGLLMDAGLGHLRGNDPTGAIANFSRALKSCSNYEPLLRLMHQLQTASQQKNG
ncbi:hypothetical protein [Coleofasciculus sp. E2-BRE-01]|uniref:hypothetical protein n=1 Tax=Coleofasciculus sp. E2-BRE-01 TaxID=3069524 RepID=UPI0032F2D8FC